MQVQTVSSRTFTRDIASAKRAANQGPVFITDRGKPAYALLKINDYYLLKGEKQTSLYDVMQSLPKGEEIDLELPPRSLGQRSIDLE